MGYKKRPASTSGSFPFLGDGNVFVEVDVLYRPDQLDAFFEGALEGFAAHDHAHAACAFVDDGGKDGIGEIGLAFALAAAVDEAYAAAIAVDHLVTGEIDGMIVGVGHL